MRNPEIILDMVGEAQRESQEGKRRICISKSGGKYRAYRNIDVRETMNEAVLIDDAQLRVGMHAGTTHRVV